jgi:putative FmdB family regulatory protein
LIDMPTYVYRCEQGHTFELFHSISDESTKHCPECGAEAKRVPAGGAGFLFKGSGFYITDYRSKGYKDAAKKEGSGGPEKPAAGGAASAPASGGTGESKPAKPAPPPSPSKE